MFLLEFDMLSECWNSFLDFKRQYPEVLIPIGWVAFGLMFLVTRWLFGKSEEKVVNNHGLPSDFFVMIKNLLLSTSNWRWGMNKGKPTGKSVLYEANGVKLICNFEDLTYQVGPEVVNKYMTEEEVEELNLLVEEKVEQLKRDDIARVELEEQKKKEKLLLELRKTVSVPEVVKDVPKVVKDVPKVVKDVPKVPKNG